MVLAIGPTWVSGKMQDRRRPALTRVVGKALQQFGIRILAIGLGRLRVRGKNELRCSASQVK